MDAKPKTSRSWRSNDGRFPDDEFLRLYGWVIKERKDGAEAIWRHRMDDGKFLELTETNAIKHVCDFLDSKKGK